MSNATGRLTLSWYRFAVLCAVILAMPLTLLHSDLQHGEPGTSAAVLLVVVSTLVFFARGWQRLRSADAIAPLSAQDPAPLMRLLIGPRVPAVIWAVTTLVVFVGTIVAQVVWAAGQ